jgi:hypothetical protein
MILMFGRQDQMSVKPNIMAGHQIQDVQVSAQASYYHQNKAIHRLRYKEQKIKKVGGQFDMKELIEQSE